MPTLLPPGTWIMSSWTVRKMIHCMGNERSQEYYGKLTSRACLSQFSRRSRASAKKRNENSLFLLVGPGWLAKHEIWPQPEPWIKKSVETSHFNSSLLFMQCKRRWWQVSPRTPPPQKTRITHFSGRKSSSLLFLTRSYGPPPVARNVISTWTWENFYFASSSFPS